MPTIIKAQNLNIRVSSQEKASLARAATMQNVKLSQFVLSTALREAKLLEDEAAIIRLSPDAFEAFVKRLDEPAREIPQLKALFAEKSIFDA